MEEEDPCHELKVYVILNYTLVALLFSCTPVALIVIIMIDVLVTEVFGYDFLFSKSYASDILEKLMKSLLVI